jgi:Recombination directionality factor-like
MTLIAAGLQPRTTYEAGRIRAGDKDEQGRPHRLDGFRFTTHSENAALQVAELYDGYDLRPWGRQWEVYTKRRNLAVALPPGKLVISQAMMRWTGGGPSVVCNGERTSKPAIGPCRCPQPDDPGDELSVWRAVEERRRLAGQKVPAGCYPYTWINMALPDIDGFGVWTLLSKSERAASEIVQQARLLEAYREAGQFSPAEVALEYNESRVEGLLRQYNVPVLRVGKSLRSVALELGGADLAVQLPPSPRERIAITTGAPALPVPAPAAPLAAEGLRTAQQTADIARTAASIDVLRVLIKDVIARRLEQAEVQVNGIPWGLREYLTLRWDEFAESDSAEGGGTDDE